MDQMQATMMKWTELALSVIATYGLQVIGAIVILILGWGISRWASGLLRRVLSRTEVCDDMLTQFFSSLLRYAILAFTVIAVLEKFGVATTSFVAILGAAGLAIGLALQGTLANVAAGVMLLIFRPFKAGDSIEAGALSGTVKGLSLFFTELATGDNVKVIVPNAKLWGDTLRNLSVNPQRKIEITVSVSYGVDIDRALTLLTETAAADARTLTTPAPTAVVAQIGDGAARLSLHLWCGNGDAGALKPDLNRALIARFRAEGLGLGG